MWGAIQAAAPYVAAVGIIMLAGLLLWTGPDNVRAALKNEYEQILIDVLQIMGPTAAAAIGDLALAASRPARLAEASRGTRWAYLFSKWASWVLFGMIGGGIVAVSGWPRVAAYMAAGVAGALGTNVVNLVFNWMLGRALPPSGPAMEDTAA